MKKTIALLLSLVMLFALVACGTKPNESKTQSTQQLSNESSTSSSTESSNTLADYPKEVINVIVPFAAGSAPHVLATAIANGLQKDLTMAISNIPGGSGSTGAMEVLHSKPDGYTLLCTGLQNVVSGVANGSFPEPQAYKLLRSVCSIGGTAQIIIASKASGLNSLEDVVNYAKENPGKLTCSGGLANTYTMAMALFVFDKLGIDVRYVPYDDTTKATTACMAGTVDLCLYGTDNAIVPVESGDCVPICLLSAERSDLYPGTPSAAEVYPDLCGDIDFWGLRGYYMSPDSPTECADIIASKIKALMDTPEFQQSMAEMGLVPHYLDRVQMEEYLDNEAANVIRMYELMNQVLNETK